MDAKILATYLAELKAAGVRTARLDNPTLGVVEVEFFPSELRGAAPLLMDRDGKPISLDDGMPELARDDIAEANFNRKAG